VRSLAGERGAGLRVAEVGVGEQADEGRQRAGAELDDALLTSSPTNPGAMWVSATVRVATQLAAGDGCCGEALASVVVATSAAATVLVAAAARRIAVRALMELDLLSVKWAVTL
jgi:hypothetical protein